MKILLSVIAGLALGMALKRNKTVYATTYTTMPAVELENCVAQALQGLNRKGINFH